MGRRHFPRLLAAAALAVFGCTEGGGRATTVTVFAASSLADVFRDLELIFEANLEQTDVRLAFAGSHTLRLQLEQGAAADVFVSANEEHMQALLGAGLLEQARAVAHNQLALVVPVDNPANIATFVDLPRARRLVIGNASVPIGSYTEELLQNSARVWGDEWLEKVRSRVVSTESNVRLVRAKVELGEADAAVVYRTDALASSHIGTVSIPGEMNVRARYRAGVVASSPVPELALAWIDLLVSAEGRAALGEHGFLTE